MKFRLRVNGGVWFTPHCEFSSEWAAWLYIKALFEDREIIGHKIDPVIPQMLQDQAL